MPRKRVQLAWEEIVDTSEQRRLAYEREESQSAIMREALDCYLESLG